MRSNKRVIREVSMTEDEVLPGMLVTGDYSAPRPQFDPATEV